MITTESKERPILFSGPMVRAILEGRKTQTRRTYKLQKEMEWYQDLGGEAEGWYTNGIGWWNVEEEVCPYGKLGDRLWIREAWAHEFVGNEIAYKFRADHHTGLEKRDGDQKWKPSIHMPRIACRLMLEITGTRVERLNEISVDDAIAEGIEPVRGIWKLYGERTIGSAVATGQPRKSYASLWQSINGPGSWAANPWVWVVEFKVL
jgi:hypothetical protein